MNNLLDFDDYILEVNEKELQEETVEQEIKEEPKQQEIVEEVQNIDYSYFENKLNSVKGEEN